MVYSERKKNKKKKKKKKIKKIKKIKKKNTSPYFPFRADPFSGATQKEKTVLLMAVNMLPMGANSILLEFASFQKGDNIISSSLLIVTVSFVSFLICMFCCFSFHVQVPREMHLKIKTHLQNIFHGLSNAVNMFFDVKSSSVTTQDDTF